MQNLSDIKTVHEILSRHGFKFSKSLGQNFIIDPDLCPNIAYESGVGPGVCALEIGPGIGVLTKELARLADKVVSIEIDKSLIPVLDETLVDYDNIKIINADVLETDLIPLIKENFGDSPFVVCANLPYYITSPILMKLLEEKIGAQSITVMVQKEAADRITALPGTRDCGAITAAIHYYSVPQKLFNVPKTSFVPSPKVDSSVIRLDVLKDPPVTVSDEKQFFKTIKAAFCQRRKTLSNSLSSGLSVDKNVITDLIIKCGFDPSIRAEQLRLDDFAILSNAVADLKK